MGLLSRQIASTSVEQLIAFDTTYAYVFLGGGFQEFIPGVTWSGGLLNANSNFFWGTNYWVNASNAKLFWVTNFSGPNGDPIRYTDGTTWTDFGASAVPTTGQIDVGGTNFLNQSLALLPFRGRLLAFNTWEGPSLMGSINFTNRIRWAAIGNPLTTDVVGPPAVPGAWRDDVRGRGGFLDIPTNEDITAVGFVRDNLVIYCERSTWQLRYTGRSIAPFQIEKVNSELGAASTFSAVQFDTSLVGVGDKGIVECDSFKSERIDIKIPDLVFQFSNENNGTERVYGIRDIQQRLAYWTYNFSPADDDDTFIFPNRRLVYNYENDSWAIFIDSFTCFGTYQPNSSKQWRDFPGPSANDKWSAQNYPWQDQPSLFPAIVAGNQQGYVEFVGDNLSGSSTNDVTLSIQDITSDNVNPTVIISPNHNLASGQIIEIVDIPTGTPYASTLNDNIFEVDVIDVNSFRLFIYDTVSGQFNTPQLDPTQLYSGGGQISVRDNFSITSKKFNDMDQGHSLQIGYIDILMDATASGAISLNVYADYDDDIPVNTYPNNALESVLPAPDTFFNITIPTTQSNLSGIGGGKFWQRVFCPVRANFITLEYTLSNAQMVGVEQESDVQIDAQVLWARSAGRMTT